MPEQRKKFGEVAVHLEFVSMENVQKALWRQQKTMINRKIGEILVSMSYLKQNQIAQVISSQMGIDLADLTKIRISQDALRLVDVSVANLYQIIPITLIGRKMIVAGSPLRLFNQELIERDMGNLGRLFDCEINLVYAPPEQSEQKTRELYDLGGNKAAVKSLHRVKKAAAEKKQDSDPLEVAGDNQPKKDLSIDERVDLLEQEVAKLLKMIYKLLGDRRQ